MADTSAYIDGAGNYLGHFDVSNAPAGATKAAVNPAVGRGSVWNGTTWVYPPPVVSPPVLDGPTLAAALIAKGVIAQTDINTAVTTNAGAAVATAVGSLPPAKSS